MFSTADTFAHFADHCKCECLNYKSSEFLEFFQNTEHYLIFLTLLIHRVSNFQLTQAFPRPGINRQQSDAEGTFFSFWVWR